MIDSVSTSRPDLSVVIVTRNTRELLHACLESIASLSDAVTWEVVVVDNASTDGSIELLRRSYPNTRLICNKSNTGYALANNQGLAVSTGRYLLLLNSDTVVQPGALARLVEFMDTHPEAGACGPLLRYPDGQLQRSCYSDPSPRSYLARMLGVDVLLPRSRLFGNQYYGFDHAQTSTVDSMLGAALLVRRKAMERVGGLDETLRIHYNDFDWCRRIRLAGWHIFFVHDAEIVHHLQGTTRLENRQLQIQAEMVKNLFDFFRKHHGRTGVAWLRFWMTLGFGCRFVLFALMHRLRAEPDHDTATRFRFGMARAGFTGIPDQFSKDIGPHQLPSG
jgi:GT2 family glycosyltransferase